MEYKKIVADAWQLTQQRKDLFWTFAFIPALLTTLVSSVYLGYQALAFRTSELFDQSMNDEFMKAALRMAEGLIEYQMGLVILFIVVAAIVVLGYFLLPVFSKGALIQSMARIRAGHEVRVLDGISFGFTRFLQLLEYQMLIKSFSIVTIITYALLVLRTLGVEAFEFFGILLGVFGIVSLLLNVLFTYSEFYLVIDKRGVFNSMLSSSSLLIRHWHQTLFMFLLMAIISVRIIFNLLIALLLPFLVVAPIVIFTSLTLAKIGLIVGIVIGLVALYFASYFLGIFDVFATAVWTFTFLELSSKNDEDGDALREQIHTEENESPEIE